MFDLLDADIIYYHCSIIIAKYLYDEFRNERIIFVYTITIDIQKPMFVLIYIYLKRRRK